MKMMLLYFPILLLGSAVSSQRFHLGQQRDPNIFRSHPLQNKRFERPQQPGYDSLPHNRDRSNLWNTHPNSRPVIAGATPFLASPKPSMGEIPLNPRPSYNYENFEDQSINEEVTNNDEGFVEPRNPLEPNVEQNPHEIGIYAPEEDEEVPNFNAEDNLPTEYESDSMGSEKGVENENEGDPIANNEYNTQFDGGNLGESENLDYIDDEAEPKEREEYEYADAEYEYEDYSAINDEGSPASHKREVSNTQPSQNINSYPIGELGLEQHEENRNTEGKAFIESPSVNQETFYEQEEYNPIEELKPSLPNPNLRQNSFNNFQERHSQNAQSFTHMNRNTPKISERADERQSVNPFNYNSNALQDYESIYDPHLGDNGHLKANIASKKRRPYKPFWESSAPSKGQNHLDGERYPSDILEDEEVEEEPDRLSLLLLKTSFLCQNMKDGYYADEQLDCEVFHFCQDKVRHSWLCPNGASFHQVHLICMPQSEDNICEKSSKFHFVNDYLYKETEGSYGKNKSYVQRYYPAGYEGGIASLEERQVSEGSQFPRQSQEERPVDRHFPSGPNTRVQQSPQPVQEGHVVGQFQGEFDPQYEQYRPENEQRLQRNPIRPFQQHAANIPQGDDSRHPRPGAAFLLNRDETVSIRKAPYVHRRLS